MRNNFLLSLLCLFAAQPAIAAVTCSEVTGDFHTSPAILHCPTASTATSGTCTDNEGRQSVISGQATSDNSGWSCQTSGAGEGKSASIHVRIACCKNSGDDVLGGSDPGASSPPSTTTVTPVIPNDDDQTAQPNLFIPPAAPTPPPSSTETLGGKEPKKDRDKPDPNHIENTATQQLLAETGISAVTNTPLKEQAAYVEKAAETVFIGGVNQVALGITQLSEAEQAKLQEGDSAEVDSYRNAGIGNIVQGTRSIDKAKATSAQALAIQKNERALGRNGTNTSESSASVPFSHAELNSVLKGTLGEMEEKAGVQGADLIHAARYGKTDDIVELAAGARGVSMPQADIAALFPNFPVSEGNAIPSYPTSMAAGIPTLDPSFKTFGASNAAGQTTSKSARNLASNLPAQASASGNSKSRDDFSNLEPESLMVSFGTPVKADGEDSLFARVHRTYEHRGRELFTARKAKAGKAL